MVSMKPAVFWLLQKKELNKTLAQYILLVGGMHSYDSGKNH
jgi:hypothetical protein